MGSAAVRQGGDELGLGAVFRGDITEPNRRLACIAAVVCITLGFAWQFLTVRYNYGGNWTALFCTGSAFPPPAPLARENIFVFANSTGYDGQFYHYVAHDPLYQTDVGRSIPDASVRYRRILLPGLAYLLAWGRQDWIDASYYTCNLSFL